MAYKKLAIYSKNSDQQGPLSGISGHNLACVYSVVVKMFGVIEHLAEESAVMLV